MMGQRLVVLGDAVRVQLLDGQTDGAVQGLAALAQHALVGDVVRQRVLEHICQLRVQRLLVDQLQSAQLVDVDADPIAGLGDAGQQTQGELPPDHGGDLNGAARLLRQAIDARDQDVLNGVGHGDVAEVGDENDASVLTPQRAVLEEGLGQLLDEEGVSLRLAGDERAQLLGDLRRAQDRAGHQSPRLRRCSGANAMRWW